MLKCTSRYRDVSILNYYRPAHMKKLRAVCKSKDVTWRELPNGDHNSSVAEPFYFNYIIEFIDKVCPRKGGRL